MEGNKKPIQQVTNRAQKRKTEKALGITQKSKEEINQIINTLNVVGSLDMSDFPKFKEYLLEGDKVMLDVEKIKKHPDWDNYNPDYREFVESNEGAVFTVKYDENKQDKPNLVMLAEDASRYQWLFWDGNLLVEDSKDGKFKSLYKITSE
jgi:hypothetical protein